MCWHMRFNILLTLITIPLWIGSTYARPVSEETSRSNTDSIISTVNTRGTTGQLPSVELLSKEPQYGELKSHFKKLRAAFLSNNQALADHEAYLKRDDSAEYSALPGLIPRKLVGNKAVGGGVPYRRSDSFFTDFAQHNPKSYILSSTEDSYIIGNKASHDVRQYSAEWDPNGVDRSSTAGMSYFHMMVIPREKVYNAVSLDDTSIIEEMISHFKKFWSTPKAAQKCADRIDIAVEAREKEVLKSLSDNPTKTEEFQAVMKDVRRSSKEFSEMLQKLTAEDFFFGFHAMPDASVGHLHMHVISTPVEMRKYSTDSHDWKTIPAKAVMEVIQGEK